jgi:inhibitor of KinA sporulation pathway (predicted exonuclease)
MKYIVVDLEATCCDQDSVPRGEMEIIEIGAVLLDENFKPVREFSEFVRPVRNPKLSPFCKQLTSITQCDVDSANHFVEVMLLFEDWIRDCGEELVWLSWGAYDKKQFIQDCNYHDIEYTLPEHLNAKVLYSQQRGCKKQFGMAKALRQRDIELDGTHHRGIDDARNIAKLIEYCYNGD